MTQTLTMNGCGLFSGAAAAYRNALEDAIGHKDRMDEPRHPARLIVRDAVPIVGPRGAVRKPAGMRPGNYVLSDNIAEDIDREVEMVDAIDELHAQLDGPGDGDDERDDEDREEHDWDGEDDLEIDPDAFRAATERFAARLEGREVAAGWNETEEATPAIAAHIAARNAHVAKRLDATRAQAEKGWYHQYLIQIAKGPWGSYRPNRMPIEAEVRLMVREGRAPSFADFCATQQYLLHLAEFIVARVPGLRARFSNAFDLAARMRGCRESVLTVLDDEDDDFIAQPGGRKGRKAHLAGRKPEVNHHYVRRSGKPLLYPHNKPTGDSQRRETLTSRYGNASIRTRAFDRMANVDPWTVHVSLQADEARAADEQRAQSALEDAAVALATQAHEAEVLRSVVAIFAVVENHAFDVVASLIDFDTAAVAWREGQTLALQKAIDRATTPSASSVTYQPTWSIKDYVEPRQSDPLDGIWEDDDLEKYERLAMRSARSNSPSFFRRMSN